MADVVAHPGRVVARSSPPPSAGGLGVVINPYAGGNRDDRRRADSMRRIVGNRGVVCETGSLDEIEEAALEFRRRGIEILAICGGDGSFFRTLSAMVPVYDGAALPPFLPLRAGSMNTIARAVGCRSGTPEAVLAATVEKCERNERFDVCEHHLIRVNSVNYGFLVGSGLIVKFLQAYYERPQRGPGAAAGLLGRVAVGGLMRVPWVMRLFDVPEASIVCDGLDLGSAAHRIIFAATVAEMGLGFRLAYRAGAGVKGFHLLAGSLSPAEALGLLPRARLGKPLGLPGWHDTLAQEVVVEFSEPTRYMIDGDILEEVSRLEMSTGPRLAIIRK